MKLNWVEHLCIALIILLSASNVACQSEANRKLERQGPTSRNGQESDVKTPEEAIVAGFGLPKLHVGMALNELGAGWTLDPELSNEDVDAYSNKDIGIYLECSKIDAKLTTICFYYSSQGWRPYKYGTSRGSNAKSFISDVRLKYGNPSFILRSRVSQFDKEFIERHE